MMMLLGIHIEVITFVVKPISFNCPSFIQKAPVAFHFIMLTLSVEKYRSSGS